MLKRQIKIIIISFQYARLTGIIVLVQYLHSTVFVLIFSVEDWQPDKRIVWTTAMDKHITGCSIASSNFLLDIPTLGGAVQCMALSPLDPSRLANIYEILRVISM